jgi:large subunit ribosomal protein L29
MKAKDLRKKTKLELTTLMDELLKEKFNLKMQKGTGQLANTSQIKKVRRDIARIHTLITEMARL